MTDSNLSLVAALLDRSGSMQSIVDDTCGGFDAFIAQERAAGVETVVSLSGSTPSTRRSTPTGPSPMCRR